MTLKTAILAATAAAFITPAYADSDRFDGFSFGVPASAPRVSGGGAGGSTRGMFGINAGYDWAVGQNYVLGVTAQYSTLRGAGGAGRGPNIQSMLDARIRAGYSMGNGLIYATLGAAQASMGAGGTINGTVIGVGFESAITDSISYNVEYSLHRYNGGGGGNPQAEGLTVGVRFRY